MGCNKIKTARKSGFCKLGDSNPGTITLYGSLANCWFQYSPKLPNEEFAKLLANIRVCFSAYQGNSNFS